MGKFFTALHVKSEGKEQFIKAFTQLMNKDGYVPCPEDEAALSYAAAFSESGWAALSNGDNSTTELSKTALKIAEEMKAPCFTVETVDSDFAILELHISGGGTSKIIVGNGEGYGVEKAPFSVNDWKPLIQNGDVEKFLAAIGQEFIFVEDALGNIGEILGITPSVMTWDYDEFEEETGQDDNVILLSFRKADDRKKTLNAAFKQVFGEALEPLGFKKIKGKYPYFVRVVPGGEIIHIIAYADKWCPYPGQKEFTVIGGVATVYRYKIDLSGSPKSNSFWLRSLSQFYPEITPEAEIDREFQKSIYSLPFKEDDETSMYDALKYAFELTNKFIIPMLDTAVDAKSALDFILRMNQPCGMNDFNSELRFDRCEICDEGFLYVKTDDEKMKSLLENMINGTIESDEESRQLAAEQYKFFNDPVIHEKVLLELERRRIANTEILRSYGLTV